MRKIYILLVLLTLGVTGMAYLYFSNLNREGSATDNSLSVVSAAAPVLFTFENDKSFYEILSGQQITDHIIGEEKSKLLSILREKLLNNNSVNQLIEGEKIVVGFLPGENNKVDFVMATQTKKAQLDLSFFNKFNLSLQKKGNFHELKFGDSATFYLAINQKSVFISNSPNALNQITHTDKTKKNTFAEYIRQNIRVNKNTLANIYIDYAKLPLLLKNILNSNLTGELSIFNKQQAYASLSYNFGSDRLLLNGYTDIQNQQNYFKLFVDQKEQKISIDQLFPEQTANYTALAINDYQKWASALKELQKELKEDTKITQQEKAISEQYRIDINQTFPQYFNKQLAVLQLKSGEKMGLIEIKNGDKLGQLLLDLSSEYAPDIRIFKEPYLLANFFGEPFKKFERPFYTIIDNHFVVANYASTIQVFLNSYKNNRLLANTDDYINFKDQTSSTATIAFYINNKNSNDIFGRNLKSAYYKQYKSAKGVKDYNSFGYQLSADNGKFMSNIILLKKQTKVELDSLKSN